MSAELTGFDKFWNSHGTKRVVGILYSLGASVVIIGALGKILHTEWGGFMLGLGMSIEAFLFALGALDKPHEEYNWNKVIDFENGGKLNSGLMHANASPGVQSKQPAVAYTETLSDEDVRKLSEGIKNLGTTATQLSSIANVAKSTENLVKNIDAASHATGQFIGSQEVLNSASTKLEVAYKSIADGIHTVDKNTKVYASKVDDINKTLASINSIYEIQIKNIQAQSESVIKHSDTLRAMDSNLNSVNSELLKIKNLTELTAEQSDLYKSGTEKLAKQVKDLNQVYGNMLNALN